MVQVDDMRHVGSENDPAGLIAGTIELLVPRVERDGEERVLLPFDGLFRLAFLPDRRRPSALEHIHDRLVEVMLGFEFAPGRYFHHLEVDIFLLAQTGVGDSPAPSFPLLKRQRVKVLQGAALVKRRALVRDESPVGTRDLPIAGCN